jgi:TPR repeat protein
MTTIHKVAIVIGILALAAAVTFLYPEENRRYVKTVIDAERGDTKAMFELSVMYDELGVTKNKKKSLDWLMRAAENGNPAAMPWIGFMYAHGDGVEKDEQKAEEWFSKYVKADGAKAMLFIGIIDLSSNLQRCPHECPHGTQNSCGRKKVNFRRPHAA